MTIATNLRTKLKMKSRSGLFVLALVVSSPAAHAGLITCWYNQNQQFTGADGAAPGTTAGGPVRVNPSGDYTWAYTIEASDGTSCPSDMPRPED
jgi:hypothetical protein